MVFKIANNDNEAWIAKQKHLIHVKSELLRFSSFERYILRNLAVMRYALQIGAIRCESTKSTKIYE